VTGAYERLFLLPTRPSSLVGSRCRRSGGRRENEARGIKVVFATSFTGFALRVNQSGASRSVCILPRPSRLPCV